MTLRRFCVIPFVVLIMLFGTLPAAAGSPLPTVTEPATYGFAYPNCPSGSTQDTIVVSGVAPTQQLNGWISAQYVLDGGNRQTIPQSVTYVNTTYDSPFFVTVPPSGPSTDSFLITYPPSSQWPVQSGGTKEIHVDLSFSVTENGTTTTIPVTGWDVFCIGNPVSTGVAPRTIGYWKNHLKWPLSSITVGSTTLNQTQALAILKNANASDMTVMLAAQLIAAELNVANGASTAIQSVISDANAFLVLHPVYSNPQGADRTTAENLKNLLDSYNNFGGG